MELKRNNKGITLIALVVTIIVLLILAGVSIATLTGNNGILTRAKDAKETTEYKSAEEKVNLAVIGAIAQDNGILKISTLRTEVENSYAGTVTGDSFPVQVTIDGKTFTVDGDGNVTNYNKKSLEELKEIIEKEPNDCMIDENGNVFPNDKWHYEITGEGTAAIKSDDDNYGSENAYKGKITDKGELQYKIPVYIKDENRVYIVNELDSRECGLFSKYLNQLENADKISEVEIPSSIEIIGEGVFYQYTGLKTINIPKNVKEIGYEAFKGCVQLRNIVIPTNVTSIANRAFMDCENLSNVTFENKEGWTVKDWTSDPEISVNVDDPAINAKI